jgi:PAS domain-containing protein
MKTKFNKERRQKQVAHAALDTTPASPASVTFPIAGIGASAGRLEALDQLGGVELRRRAQARLLRRPSPQRAEGGGPESEADSRRLFHELQVHQVELEMQNVELQEARDRLEVLLEKYTDLYDFAPVGYFSLDEQGLILEANLTGAALLGVERFRLINRRLLGFVVPASRPVFLAFLERAFAGSGKQFCEAELLRAGDAAFWGGLSRNLRNLRRPSAEMVPGGDFRHHLPEAG